MAEFIDLRKKLRTKIAKNPDLGNSINKLFENFKKWKEKSADAEYFFNQPYFSWEESLINKFAEVDKNIEFDSIKDEWINLALLTYSNWERDFRICLNKISNKKIKETFIQEIFNKIQNEIWGNASYSDFNTECSVSPWDTNVLGYLQKVVSYLNEKQENPWTKKTVEILRKITITNEDLNWWLSTDQIPSWVPLTSDTIPANIKNTIKDFDVLLSFEIGKEADRTINIANDISQKLQWLYSNAFPAINTIVGENERYRYNENKLWSEYEWKLKAIKDNAKLSEAEKEKEIKDLKREYYIKYLKKTDPKIGKAMEELYKNNFDFSKIEDNVLKWYIDKVVNLRLKSLFNNGLHETLELSQNIDEFEDFYKKLADPCIKEIHLDNRVSPWTSTPNSINLPIKKTIIPWEHPWLKDIDEFWSKEKSYDYLPIRYEINKEDVEKLQIGMEDKINLMNFLSRFETEDKTKYVIEWQEAWSLIYLFFVINSKTPITHVDLEKQKELEELFWDTKKSNGKKDGDEENENDKENKDDNKDDEEKDWEKDEINDEKKSEVENNDTPKNFINDIEKLWPWIKFENWCEVRLPRWSSELPGWWYKRMKLKINKIDKEKWTFEGKFFWWELKFNDKLEWKNKKFNMNNETLKLFKNVSKDPNKVLLLPNPDNSDFNSFKNKLNWKLGNWDISLPDWVNRDGKKFMHNTTDENGKEKSEEANFFWVNWDDTISYKVEYKPSSHSFKVSCDFNWEDEKKDWKTENVRYKYSRDMDWNNFLIFVNQKWLTPQKKEEVEKAKIKQDEKFQIMNWWQWKLNWFSLSNIKNVFKSITWSIKKKVDEYNKNQDQKLEDILVWDRWIYSKLASILWFIPSIKQWLWELEQEFYNERDNRSWKKIEWYLKIFQWDPDFWTTFDKVPPFAQILWWKSYKEFIIWLFNAKRKLGDDNIQKAAALLLANIEKWWSPYRGLPEYENLWLWVKVLLWDDHYKNFLQEKIKLIEARDKAETSKNSWLDKKSLNNQLATFEMDYIINNIRWTYWNAEYAAWSNEKRWKNLDKKTEYIDNPSKRLLSDQFANKLEWMKWWLSKSSVEESYWKYKSNVNSFEKAEDEFNKTGSTRYQKGAAALRLMFDYASDDSMKMRAKKCFLLYLLSWALDIYSDAWLKKQIYWRAKPMSFVPWMLIKEKNVASNIAILLDNATDWDFSRHVTKYFHENDLIENKWTDFKWLKEELNTRLTDEKMKELDQYFSKLPTMDFSNEKNPKKKAILEKYKKSILEEDIEEFDRWLLTNPTIVNNWLLTNIDVVSDRLKFEDWEFRWNDSDDISNKKKFRKDVSADIESRDFKDGKTVNFVLNKYLSRFGMNSIDARQNIYKWINTANFYKNKVEKRWVYRPIHRFPLNNWKDELPIPLWNITKDDIDKVLLYALEGNIRTHWLRGRPLPPELKEALDKFQTFFKKAFHQWTLYDDYVKKSALKSWDLWENDIFLLWWWDQYKKMKEKENDNTTDEWDDINNWSLLKPSKKRDYLRTIFKVENKYVNQDMEDMYNTLKRNRNIITKDWELSIASDDSDRPQDCQIDSDEKNETKAQIISMPNPKEKKAKIINMTNRNLSQWLKSA